MCVPGLDPITIASIAASGAGALYNRNVQNEYVAETNNQNKIQMAREAEATEAERQRQLALEQQQAQAVTEAILRADPGRTAEKVAIGAPASEVAAIPDDYSAPVLQGQVGDSDSAATIGEIIKASTDRLRKVLTSASVLTDQDTALRGVGDDLIRMSGNIQTIGSNRQGSLNASAKERSIPAATVERNMTPIGDLLMLGGQAVAGRTASGQPLLKKKNVFGNTALTG